MIRRSDHFGFGFSTINWYCSHKDKKKKFKVKTRKQHAGGEKVNDLEVKGLNSESNDYIVRVVHVFWTNNREN